MNAEPGSADGAPPERLHPLILLTGLGGSLRGLAGGYAGVVYLAATGKLGTALLVGGAFLLFLAVSPFTYWRRFSYRVGASEVRIDSGLLNRTHRSIPFDRVQDVDISQGPLERLFGLAKVKFETGGSAGGDDAVLPAIAVARAHDLREHVRTSRGRMVFTETPAQEAESAPIFTMDLGRVLLAGVFGFSLAIFAGLFGATQTLGDVIGFDPLNRRFWEQLLTGHPLAGYVAQHRFASGIAGLLLLVAIGFVTGIVRSLLRDFRFRLERTGAGLRRRRGLLTLTDVTLPLRRIQAAILLSGPVRERFGWRELKFQSLSGDEGSKGDHVVAPLADEAEIDAILAEVGWRLPDQPAAWEPVSRRYGYLTSAWLVPLLLLALASIALDPLAGGLATIGLLAIAAQRWLAWKRSGFLLEPERLLIRSGWLRRRTIILPLASIQSIDLSENALTRRLGLARLTFGVAGGSGFSGHFIPAVPRERATQIREHLLSPFA